MSRRSQEEKVEKKSRDCNNKDIKISRNSEQLCMHQNNEEQIKCNRLIVTV